MKALVIGAGIAGLAAAHGLKRIGWEVEVFEQAPVLKPVGAGLVLAANALKALNALGLLERVMEVGQPLNTFSIRTHTGACLTDTNYLLMSERYGIQSCFSIHRADLQEKLLQGLQVHVGKRCQQLRQTEQSVSVRFDDGSEYTADLLLGCDGLHSAVRQQVAPQARKRFAGYTCWRGVTSQLPAGLDPHQASESWGIGSRFGLVPLTQNRVYWFACLNTRSPQDPVLKSYGLAALKEQFRNYHPPVSQLLDYTSEQALLWNDILDLEPLSSYVYGRVVLVGDAAHATTPNLGQGACQALEGTAVLMAKLSTQPLPQALQAYNAERVPRASSIVKRSWQLGKVAHLSHPLGVWLRNRLLRMVPDSVNQKQLDELLGIQLAPIPAKQYAFQALED